VTPCLYCGEASDGVGGGARTLGGRGVEAQVEFESKF